MKLPWRALTLATLILLTDPIAATPPDMAVVITGGGRIRGERLADRIAFRGIPFAAPPVGPLRWRPPAPVRSWAGVRDATRSAPACAQLSEGWNKGNADYSAEDCLYLEIATPSLTPARRLPVLVWIHGGSNTAGGGAGTIASSMVRRGIVLVSIQYRLGALGFMAHPALTAESPHHASGNYGLMDQQAALVWVQRNIARFGGDPTRVTLGGQSAGAMDVGLQQVSPRARGLFHAAIEESGTAGFGFPPRNLRASEAIGERIIAQAGRPHASATALRALPVATLLEAMRGITLPGLPEAGSPWVQTTIDGHVITEPPAATLARGAGQRVPLLIGTNAQEIDFYPDLAAARRRLPHAFGAKADAAARFYGLERPDAPPADPIRGTARMQIGTDIVFNCPTGFVAGARRRSGVSVWRYDFNYQPSGGPAPGHSSELRHVFGNPGEDGIATDAPPLQAYWANFIRSGTPNGAGLVPWPVYGAEQHYLGFGTGKPAAATGLRAALCANWSPP
ncbi:MAG: carboxylesterase family protein [Pseudomonadota bacterium]|uniref:carboxylesterase/lipase family protein n=1 Tax=Sphingomonas sp. ERG5 TaxID=1381597 RepID=UPI00068F8435|nr:carboxylesterase family protein [Sphingomonas sp. ERG5]